MPLAAAALTAALLAFSPPHHRAARAPRAAAAPASPRCGARASALPVHTPNFLDLPTAAKVAALAGTPCYVYDAKSIVAQARTALAFPNAHGLTVRFAMKACPNRALLQLLSNLGVQIDASSVHEVRRAMLAGIPAAHISLSSQELPTGAELAEIVGLGVKVNACSVPQLRAYGQACAGARVGLRINPGVGSGGTGKTNVGGPSSSFGIWHELLPEAQAALAEHGLTCERVHTHIGSGSDPAVWQAVAELTLGLAAQLPDVATVNLGGGFKVGRVPGEASTDMATVGVPVKAAFEAFAQEHGRALHLEIEPGTFLVCNAGAILARVQDATSTGAQGHHFLKLDTGMTELLRPSLYGARHPIATLPADAAAPVREYIVSGHCCESGDLLTCAPGEAETLERRALRQPQLGDLVVVDGAGAYCAGMAAKNYNAFPECAEVLLDADGEPHVVRARQTLEQMLQNEAGLPQGFSAP